MALQWRYNGRDSVSNHQPHDCLFNLLFRRRPKKTSKLRDTGLCSGNSPVTGEFPAKWPITRKMFPFDDVIMVSGLGFAACVHGWHLALLHTITQQISILYLPHILKYIIKTIWEALTFLFPMLGSVLVLHLCHLHNWKTKNLWL